MSRLLLVSLLLAAQDEKPWKPLFNGKDLAGWETWLGRAKAGEEPLGLNRDPGGVFTVVELDGAPAIRISGERAGEIATTEDFENYHFRVEFKWGQKRWAPRDNDVRDSGVFYHGVGPHGAAGGAWMKSLQLSLGEEDSGDFWSVGGAFADLEGDRVDLEKDGELDAWKKRNGTFKGKGVRYRKGGEKIALVPGGWAIQRGGVQKPVGEWNRIEVLAVGQTSIHVVNGAVAMVLTGARHRVEGKEVPLTRGRIQLQSEFAEVYFRKPEIRSITALPADMIK